MGMLPIISEDTTSTQRYDSPPEVMIERGDGSTLFNPYTALGNNRKWWLVAAVPVVVAISLVFIYLLYLIVKQHRTNRRLRDMLPVQTAMVERANIEVVVDDSRANLISPYIQQ